MKKWLILIALSLPLLFSFSCSNTNEEKESSMFDLPPSEEIAVLDTTEGAIVLGFYPDVAPNHVENFKKLANENFYDETKFHRVIFGFMVQGGCPNTKDPDKLPYEWGRGGPGYTIDAEFNSKRHVRGTLSMARSSDPNSAGSQFFICHGDAPHLDGSYTAFGYVLDGMNVVDTIAESEVVGDRPVDPVTLKTVRIMPVSEWEEKKKS
ncbi:peptidylprolyl isomerase [bacterium]|nr:peptidylprolyl isomerase [bacterium]